MRWLDDSGVVAEAAVGECLSLSVMYTERNSQVRKEVVKIHEHTGDHVCADHMYRLRLEASVTLPQSTYLADLGQY